MSIPIILIVHHYADTRLYDMLLTFLEVLRHTEIYLTFQTGVCFYYIMFLLLNSLITGKCNF